MGKDMKKQELPAIPSTQALEEEIKRIESRSHHRSAAKRAVYLLVTVAAAAVLLATLFLPVLRIYGTSMAPTMENGDVVVAVKNTDIEPGDVIAFYYNNKVLVKRVIGRAGDWIDMDETGAVLVNGIRLEEPYLTAAAYGDTNIDFPYQVPDSKFFVMGDHRETSIDSRNTAVGCVGQEQIVGKVVSRIWPLTQLGMIR